MKNCVVLLALTMCIFCVRADEIPTDKEPQPSSLIDTAFCYISPKPWNCVRIQAGRTLDYWQAKIEKKRVQLLAEADEEVKNSDKSRGLTDEEQPMPSELISTLDKGFNAVMTIIRQRRALQGGKQLDDINDTTSDSIVNDDISFFSDDDDDEGKIAPSEARGKETNTDLRQNTNLQGFGGYDDDVTYYGGYKGSKGTAQIFRNGKLKKGKKGKKGLMKLFFLGTIIKSKIELLLKVLSFKLQIKFLLIAAVNLFINLARFWIDLKKQPSKVVVVEHSQHQHHYDHEHENNDWGAWKRQSANQQEYNGDFAHRIAYNGYPAVQGGVTY